MKIPWLFIAQIILVICWYAVPGMALAPAFLIFLPTIIAVLLLTFVLGGVIIAALIAART
jgi:hypothetical protein